MHVGGRRAFHLSGRKHRATMQIGGSGSVLPTITYGYGKGYGLSYGTTGA